MAQYFVYDPSSGGFSKYDTEAEARKEAEEILDYYRDDSADGWNEDDVLQICWGELRESAVQISREPAPEGSQFDYIADFGLRPVD